MSYEYSFNTKQNEKTPAAGHIYKKTLNILIVDDDETVADIFKMILSDRGHNVLVINDCITCINYCKNDDNKYDMIFLDYHMDGLNGIQLAEVIKDANNKPIIFAYTGDNSDKAIREFIKVGINGAVIKPVDLINIQLLMSNIENHAVIDKQLIKHLAKKSNKTIMIFDEITL